MTFEFSRIFNKCSRTNQIKSTKYRFAMGLIKTIHISFRIVSSQSTNFLNTIYLNANLPISSGCLFLCHKNFCSVYIHSLSQKYFYRPFPGCCAAPKNTKPSNVFRKTASRRVANLLNFLLGFELNYTLLEGKMKLFFFFFGWGLERSKWIFSMKSSPKMGFHSTKMLSGCTQFMTVF